MVLVPLGISMNSWTKSIDSKSKGGSNNKTFTDNTGSHMFQRVSNESPGEKNSTKKDGLSNKIKTKMISPVQQVLEQTKEKEKRSDGPDTVDVSFNMASTSSGMSNKRKTARKKKQSSTTKSTPSSSSSSEKKKTVKKSVGSTIKRLQRKRNSQSKKNLGTGKKSSSLLRKSKT